MVQELGISQKGMKVLLRKCAWDFRHDFVSTDQRVARGLKDAPPNLLDAAAMATGGGEGINFVDIFDRVDKDKNGLVTRAELIKALPGNPELQKLLKLPARIGDEQRKVFEPVFQEMDVDGDRMITKEEFLAYVNKSSEDNVILENVKHYFYKEFINEWIITHQKSDVPEGSWKPIKHAEIQEGVSSKINAFIEKIKLNDPTAFIEKIKFNDPTALKEASTPSTLKNVRRPKRWKRPRKDAVSANTLSVEEEEMRMDGEKGVNSPFTPPPADYTSGHALEPPQKRQALFRGEGGGEDTVAGMEEDLGSGFGKPVYPDQSSEEPILPPLPELDEFVVWEDIEPFFNDQGLNKEILDDVIKTLPAP